MKSLTSSEIRNMFLKYFESKDHLIIPSASLIPDNDPSILWINAGVAPLKKYFDGRENPPKKRLTNSQKCIRTNDIENVGKTARHHTFFEMLGNFSIGDYFRDEALGYAYEFLTSHDYLDIDKDKLYVTVYPDDKDTYNRWIKLGIDFKHIVKCEDNFWDIGPGPCGPDTEIFYDRGSEYDKRGIELIEKDIENDRYIEIWNNVLSQFNHVEGMERKNFPELPHKNIDTGMGLERLTCIIQGGKTNYDTDLFFPIMKEIENISGVKYDGQMAFKAIADHIKTLVFALSDGADFSNEGRGYVLRRILRRASRFGRTINIYEPFMYKLTGSVIEIMKDAYPDLGNNKLLIDKEIKKEEETFLKTLSSGEKKLKELEESGNKITGKDVFKLYDTYGFPYELTSEILEEKGISIDKSEFDSCMEKQKEMARNASKKVSGMNVQNDLINFKEESTFTGYDELETKANIIYLCDDEGNEGTFYSEGMIILDKTPFYASMGGQEHDTGFLLGDGIKAEVLDVFKAPNKQNVCYVRMLEGALNIGDSIMAEVDKERRFTTCQNHSATHLLQKALQEVLGNEVHQAGSYVDNETLRFDFKYSGKITDDDIIKTEKLVNDMIHENRPADIKEMKKEDATKLGAMALFSEKYGDVVRVVKFGNSVELCGGTHVTNTGNIRSFAIKMIESKGLNIYRIEAVCDTNLETEIFEMIKPYNNDMILLLKKAKKIVSEAEKKGITLEFNPNISNEKPTCYKDILDNKEEVNNLKKEVSLLESEYSEKLTNKLLSDVNKYLESKKQSMYGDIIMLTFEDEDLSALKSLCGALCSKLVTGIVFITNKKSGSINFIAKETDDLKDKFNVGRLIKDVSLITDGNGGGSPLFAQGGGTNIDKLTMAMDYAKSKLLEEE